MERFVAKKRHTINEREASMTTDRVNLQCGLTRLADQAALFTSRAAYRNRGSPAAAREPSALARWRATAAGAASSREGADELACLSLLTVDHTDEDVDREINHLALLATSDDPHDYGLLRTP